MSTILNKGDFYDHYATYTLNKYHGMKDLSAERENNIVDAVISCYSTYNNNKADMMFIDVIRSLSALDVVIHKYLTSSTRPEDEVFFECAEAYTYIMYFLPKILNEKIESFMYVVNEEALKRCGDSWACSVDGFNDIIELFKEYSISILINQICVARITGHYNYNDMVKSCASVVVMISVLLDFRGIYADEFDLGVDTILRWHEKEHKPIKLRKPSPVWK